MQMQFSEDPTMNLSQVDAVAGTVLPRPKAKKVTMTRMILVRIAMCAALVAFLVVIPAEPDMSPIDRLRSLVIRFGVLMSAVHVAFLVRLGHQFRLGAIITVKFVVVVLPPSSCCLTRP